MSTETMADLSVDATTADNIERRISFPPVSDEVAAAVRDLVDTIVVPTKSKGLDARLHIDDGDGETLCNARGFDGVSKSIDCYPPGFRSWCIECVAEFRLDHGGVKNEGEQHRHVGKTVSTNQRYWYEVHDAAEPGKVRLLAIDNVPNRVITHEELDECMAGSWNVVYDGQTGELGDDLATNDEGGVGQ